MRRDRMRVSTVWPGGLYTQNTPLSALYTVGAYTSMDIMHWDSPTSISAHTQATSMLCNTTDDCQHSLDCDHDLSRRIMEVENTSESHTSTSITATCVCVTLFTSYSQSATCNYHAMQHYRRLSAQQT